MRGGRRLWPSRDERKWGHDKYDEMNTQEKQYDVVISLSPIHFFFVDIFPLAVSIHFSFLLYLLLIFKLIDKTL